MSIGYSIEINLIHVVVCRLMMYNALIVDILSPFYLIGASIDQFLITSTNVRIRQRSSVRFAYISNRWHHIILVYLSFLCFDISGHRLELYRNFQSVIIRPMSSLI